MGRDFVLFSGYSISAKHFGGGCNTEPETLSELIVKIEPHPKYFIWSQLWFFSDSSHKL